MQKTKHFAMRMCLTLAVLSAFGFVIRWSQNIAIFEEGTGLATEGAPQSIFLVIYSIVVVVALAFIALPVRNASKKTPPAYCVRSENKARRALVYISGLAFVIAAIILFLTSDDKIDSQLLRILSVLMMLAGFCFMHNGSAGEDSADSPLACLTAVTPVFFCSFWLIMSYRQHSANPVIWVYSIEIIAIVVACLALYLIAGFPFGKPRVYKTIVATATAAFFCCMALGDTREISFQICFVALVTFFVTTLYNIIMGLEYNIRSELHM